MKAVCKICAKIFFRPTKFELGERMLKHMEIRHPKILAAEFIKAQALYGVLVTRHFDGDPDIESDQGNVLTKTQLIEMIQMKRDEFDFAALEPGLTLVPTAAAVAPPAASTTTATVPAKAAASLSKISDFGVPVLPVTPPAPEPPPAPPAPPATEPDPNPSGGQDSA